MSEVEQLRERVAELEALARALAWRLVAVSEVLANVVNKRCEEPTTASSTRTPPHG